MPRVRTSTPPPKTVNVLCVEDELPIREAITDLLQLSISRFDVNVIAAGNGEEGLKQLHYMTPDLIISDVSMPRMDGFQFLSELRKEHQWARIPFIFLTAHGSQEAERMGRKHGIEQFITKPFDPAEFVKRVETQLKRAFEEQDKSNQAFQTIQKEIAHVLQHEFRTPLTFVMAYFDFLLTSTNEQPDYDEIVEHLNGIASGDRRLTRLVSDLVGALDVRSGVVARKIEQKAVEIDSLPQIVTKVVQRMQSAATANRVSLKVDVPAHLPPIYGVASEISRMLERLLDNAIKLMPFKTRGAKRIWVSAEATHEDTVRFIIRDNGIGFPHHLRERIFELFYQHNRQKYEQQGPGVGLTLVKGVVEAHGGHIEARSQMGEGATFIVDLPIYQGNPDIALRPLAANIDRKITILVVEDEPAVLANLELLLTIANTTYEYEVLTATNGVEALAVMRKTVPDIILSDVLMPRLNGHGFLEKVRANPEWLHLPVIFLTAKGEATDESLGRRLGVDDYVTKPYNADHLLNVVETRLLRHLQKREAELSEFDALRERVLRSVNRSVLLLLASIRDHIQHVRTLLKKDDFSVRSAEMRQVITLMKNDTDKLSKIINKIMALTELRSGMAASSFEKRAQMLEGMGSVVHNAIESVMAAEEYRHSAKNAQIKLAPPPFTAPILGEKRSLEVAVANLLEFCLLHSKDARLKLTIIDKVEQVRLRVAISKSALSDSNAQIIETLLSTPDAASIELDDTWVTLIIAKEYITMHGGTVNFTYSSSTYQFNVDLPTYDPFA